MYHTERGLIVAARRLVEPAPGTPGPVLYEAAPVYFPPLMAGNISLIMVMAAGPTSTMKIAGKMNSTSGKISLTAVLAAFSSAIWRRRDSNGADTVYVNRFVGALGAWTGVVAHITPATESIDPQIVFDANGNAFAGWIGRQPASWGDGSVYVLRYDRATNTWSTLEELTRRIGRGRTARNVTAFKLAVDSQGNALAVWEQEQDGTGNTALYSSRYIDGEWIEPTVRATSDRRSSGGGRIVAAIHGSLASIGWLQDSSDDLYVVRLTASGWSEAESIETLDGNFIYEPTLGMDAAGNVTVAFKMDVTFKPESKRMQIEENAVSKVVDGKIVQAWVNEDDLGLQQQLGGRVETS